MIKIGNAVSSFAALRISRWAKRSFAEFTLSLVLSEAKEQRRAQDDMTGFDRENSLSRHTVPQTASGIYGALGGDETHSR